jgi:hypothetical protein
MKTNFYIIFIISVVLLVGGLGIFMSKDSSKPSKYDGLAKALTDSGAKFYGAFWCPHCQDQKAEFGSSKKFLPYVECSNPDNSPTQVCTDSKIESYPTWKFKDGIKVKSATDPLVCEINDGKITESENCKGRSSQYYKTWFFQGVDFSIKSPTEPVREGDEWKFSPEAEAGGKISIPSLAEQINFTLPQ